MKNYIYSLLVIVFLSACSTPGPKQYDIRATAEPVINRDAAGKPLSVVVRLYQLKQANDFTQLTFDLAASGRSDAELLGASMIQKNEVVLVPGGQFVDKELLAPDTKYIGVLAFFRRPDSNFWRFLIDAEEVKKKGLTLVINDCYLSLKSPTAVAIPGQALDAKPVCREDTIASSPASTSSTGANTSPVVKGKEKHSAWKKTKKQKSHLAAPHAAPAPLSSPEASTSNTSSTTSITSTAGKTTVTVGAPSATVNKGVAVPAPPIEVRLNSGLNWSTP